jgi:integrase
MQCEIHWPKIPRTAVQWAQGGRMSIRRANGEGSIYRTKDGRWRGSIVLPGGKRKYVSGATRKQVVAKIADLARRTSRGQVVPDQRISVAQWLQRWLDEAVEGQVEAKTARDYRDIVRRHLLPHVGDFRLIALQPRDVIEMHRSLLAAGYSSATVHKTHRVLARALAIAVRWGLLDRNVAALVSAPKIRIPQAKPLTAFEVLELRRHCRDATQRARLYLALLGLRQGEALGLCWEDIHLESNTLLVQRSLQRNVGGPSRLKDPKSAAGKRVVVLPDLVAVALGEHWREQARLRASAKQPWPEQPNLVFRNKFGGPKDHRRDHREWVELLDRAGVAPRRLHDARHTAGTLLAVQGVGTRAAMSWLGHSQVSQTMRYTHVVDALARDTGTKLGLALFGE